MKRIQTVAIALLLFFSIDGNAQNIDIDLLKSINKHSSGFKNDLSNAASGSVTPITIAAPVSILAAGLIKHDKKLQLQAAYMAGGGILTILITQASKRIIRRDRPFVTYSFIVQRTEETGFSFPSGHTSSAFNTATALSILYPKWYVIAPGFLWAGTVGFARMYEGVHYPSDVLAGALVGAGSAWVSYKVQRWIEKKANTKKVATPTP